MRTEINGIFRQHVSENIPCFSPTLTFRVTDSAAGPEERMACCIAPATALPPSEENHVR